jgi:uncharacterized GH25 family protein
MLIGVKNPFVDGVILMRRIPILILAMIGASASGHDLWLQPNNFQIANAGSVPVAIFAGHGKDRENWGIRSDRIIALRSMNPGGQATDLMPLVKAGTAAPAIRLHFEQAGTHVILMQSNAAKSDLPAARFNDYLQQEGLTPAIAQRRKTRSIDRPGRELYSRRGKTLVRVGHANGAGKSVASRRFGLALEIVPERDPYLLGPAQTLPVRVYFEGHPLSGALVKLTNLDADARPMAAQRTDGDGRAHFNLPGRGKWLLNVIWTKPLAGNSNADFQTIFSSLSFG